MLKDTPQGTLPLCTAFSLSNIRRKCTNVFLSGTSLCFRNGQRFQTGQQILASAEISKIPRFSQVYCPDCNEPQKPLESWEWK